MSADHFPDERYKITPPKEREGETRQATPLLTVESEGEFEPG